MTGTQVLYSSYGHIETMAEAIAEVARDVPGTEVTTKRVPELVPEDAIARKAGFALDQKAPVARPEELADYDAIIFGTPARFGNIAAQNESCLTRFQGRHVAEITHKLAG